jgi:hypothetical protein
MIISVINLSGGAIEDRELQRAIRAVNRPGGYIGFFDPKIADVMFSGEGDEQGAARLRIKKQKRVGRGQLRRLISRE